MELIDTRCRAVQPSRGDEGELIGAKSGKGVVDLPKKNIGDEEATRATAMGDMRPLDSCFVRI
jgi:hypothetical protein